MPHPFPNLPPHQRGTVHWLRHESLCLSDNPWGDPTERDLIVYTPHGWEPGVELPAITLLIGFSGTGEKLLARSMSNQSIATRIDRMIARGCPPFIAVMPDCMTRVGGSQYVDSPGLGNYATYVADELTSAVDQRIGTNGRWGVLGHSSGGFGALHLAMNKPGRFEAAACHSGDLGFDLCYTGDIPRSLSGVAALGGLEGFVDAFWELEQPRGAVFAALNVIAMSCAYSPDPEARPVPARLPIDYVTGELDFDVLKRWARFDPIEQVDVPEKAAALRELGWLFFDCGDRDEYNLQYGARRFARKLEQLQIPHTYEEFAGGHGGVRYRWERSLTEMAERLS